MILIEIALPLFPILLLVYYFKVKALPQLWPYVEQGIIGILLADYFAKFVYWQKYFLLSDQGDAFLFECLICLIELAVIYLLNRYLGPRIDQRNIRKTPKPKGLTPRSVFTLLLLVINPIYTANIILWGCGYGGICTFFTYLVSGSADSDEQDVGITFVYTAIVYLCVLVAIAWGMVRKWSKNRTPLTLAHLSSNRPPILFLRSFQLNKSAVSHQTFDEHLCDGFALQQQPVISLADPDVAFTDGTIKLQTRDLSWKQVIAKLLQDSRAVIMFEGRSDGLKWEIENIKNYVSNECFFVATPPEDYRLSAWVTGDTFQFGLWRAKHFSKSSIRHAYRFIWNQFSGKLNSVGIHVPDEDPGSGSLISFNRDWTVRDILRGLDGSAFFERILALTSHRPVRPFDYDFLRQSVGDYEVSGTIDDDLLRRCKRFVRAINLAFLTTAILLAVVIAVI